MEQFKWKSSVPTSKMIINMQMQMKYYCVNATTSSQAHDGTSPLKVTNFAKK